MQKPKIPTTEIRALTHTHPSCAQFVEKQITILQTIAQQEVSSRATIISPTSGPRVTRNWLKRSDPEILSQTITITYYQVDNGRKFVEVEVDAVPSDLQSWSRGICRERSCIRRTEEGYASRVQGCCRKVLNV